MSDNTIAVVGVGLLGRGIAACLLGHGYNVIACDSSLLSLARAEEAIAEAFKELAEHSAVSDSLRDSWRNSYRSTTDLSEVAGASFIIESVVEDIGVKSTLLDDIEQLVDSETPIASNTSAIPISLIQQGRRHPERFLGMHWAEPAYATRFLELIRGEATCDEAFYQAIALAKRCRKEASFVLQDIPGFIANRLGYAIYREAIFLLEKGAADAETIDTAFRNSVGLWATFCGPFRWIDLTGGPAFYAKAMRPVLPTLSESHDLPSTLNSLAVDGAEGIINGRGLFDYSPDEAACWREEMRRHAWKIKLLVDDIRPL